MIERVHEHLLSELNTNARTDTVFVITGILLNLVILGVNSAIAGGSNNGGNQNETSTVIMFMFVALVIVVNFVVEIGLIRGRQMRRKLLTGLMKMYKDQNVEGYYDPSLLTDYKTRYNLFLLAVLFTGIIAIIIPFVIR